MVLFEFQKTDLAATVEDGCICVRGAQREPWEALVTPPPEVMMTDPVEDGGDRNQCVCQRRLDVYGFLVTGPGSREGKGLCTGGTQTHQEWRWPL